MTFHYFISSLFRKINRFNLILLLLVLGSNSSLIAGTIKVGIARKIITPATPVYLTGYAGRDKPATGVIHDLWAKAVVLQENEKNKIIIVSTDLLGLSHEVSESVTKKIQTKYNIDRSQLMLNSSHTHSGPMIWPSLSVIADYTPAEQQVVSKYTLRLIDDLVSVIDSAFARLKPMNVYCGHDSAGFARNRRLPTDKGIINAVNENGPVDHDVPVLKITSLDGVVKAVLFGYACHNTTVVGDNYLVNGDYAGFAQLDIEKAYPGSTALFLLGCAGDQNPLPRGTVELAVQHGKSLADAVIRALRTEMVLVNVPIRTSREIVDLPFKPFTVETFEKDIIGNNKFLQRRAKLMLEAYNKGWIVDKYAYTVQAIRFGNELTLLALNGEVVIDYALRVKQEYPKENMWVAGYSNEVMCYIPSKRVLQEGGYEAVDNMIYYGMPGPFAESIEQRIFSAIHSVMKKVAVK